MQGRGSQRGEILDILADWLNTKKVTFIISSAKSRGAMVKMLINGMKQGTDDDSVLKI